MHTTLPRLLALAHTALIALTTVCAVHHSEALADDVDLFFESGAGSNATPNVLLILDNSASMLGTFGDPPVSKAAALIETTEELLKTLNGVDVGLMTYNGRGARVLEPIRPLDAPGFGADAVSVRVSDPADDAAIYSETGGQGQFIDFSPTPTNTPLAPVYANQGAGADPVIPSIAASKDAGTVNRVWLRGEALTSYLGDTLTEALNGQILNPRGVALRVPDLPGGRFIPLGSHFDGDSVEATLNVIRFNMADAGWRLPAIRGGCIVDAYIRFTTTSFIADPENDTSFLIHATPLSAASAVDNSPPDSLPRFGNAINNFLDDLDIEEIGHPGDAARPTRWDAVGVDDELRTPNLSHIVQSSLGHAAFADSIDNDYLYFSVDPRSVYDGDVNNDLSVYGLPGGFADNPPPGREVYANSNTYPARKPTLVLSYSDSPCRVSGASTAKHMLGMIFRDVRVPRNAPVKDARLYLYPANDYLSRDDFRMNVYIGRLANPDGHNWDAPAPSLLASGAGDNVVWIDPGRGSPDPGIFTGPRTSETQWTTAYDITSPDLSRLVEDVVNDPAWCGGDSLIVYIEPRQLSNTVSDRNPDGAAQPIAARVAAGEQLRAFHTFDSSTLKAPRIEISFGDPPDRNNACNVYERRFVPGASDAAIQDIDSACSAAPDWNLINFTDPTEFKVGGERVHFVNFRGIDIPRGTEIVSANLLMSNFRTVINRDERFPRYLSIQTVVGQSDDDIPAFGDPYDGQRKGSSCFADYLLNERSSAPAIWDLGAETWSNPNDPIYSRQKNVLRTTVELAAQVQRSVDAPAWTSKDDIIFMLHSLSNNDAGEDRRAFNVSGLSNELSTINNQMPVLVLQWRSDTVPSTSVSSHRKKMIDSVKSLYFDNYLTPYYSSLREAAAYFGHEPVYYGQRRSPGPDPKDPDRIFASQSFLTSRVSSVHSHNGQLIRAPMCTGTLTSIYCAENKLSPGARYHTDGASERCEPNYVILLTDGVSTGYYDDFRRPLESWINSLAPDVQCGGLADCPGEASAAFSREIDTYSRIVAYLAGDSYRAPANTVNSQPISFFTVGVDVFDESVESDRKARALLRTIAKNGNGQFFLVNDRDEMNATFNSIFDVIGTGGASLSAPSLAINAFNSLFTLDETFISMFLPQTTRGIWQGNIKKYRLRTRCFDSPGSDDDGSCYVGQLLDADGNAVLDETQRIRPVARSFWSSAPDGAVVDKGGAGEAMAEQPIYPVLLFTDEGADTPAGINLSATPAYSIDTSNISALRPLLEAAPLADDDMINWMRGEDVTDSDSDGNSKDLRWPVLDSMHTGLLPVIFGYDDSADRPILKLFATSNAGEIRLINGESGREEWRYIPRDMLSKAAQFLNGRLAGDNPNSTRLYGIDGPMSSMIFDCNRNGLIESKEEDSECDRFSTEVVNDRVLLFATSRRGGDRIYAFEAEPSAGISRASSLTDITPRFLWTIDHTTPGYSQLGQTWSQAVPMRIYTGDDDAGQATSRLVVAFGGGYDTRNDLIADSNAPIAPDLDDNPSLRGAAVYFADMLTGECVLHIGPRAESGCDYSTVVSDMKYSVPMAPGFLDSGLQGSTPLARGVDRFYFADLGGQVFRVDLNADNAASPATYAVARKIADFGIAGDSSGRPRHRRQFYNTPFVAPVRNDYTYSNSSPHYDLVLLASGTRPFPRAEGVQDRAYVLRDDFAAEVYDPAISVPVVNELDMFNSTEELPDIDDLRASAGFYLSFDEDRELKGEKTISQGTLLTGTWFFSTFSPESLVADGQCTTTSGVGRLYAINILSGQPAFDQNQDTALDITDRASVVSEGLISDIVPAFLEGGAALLVNSEGGTSRLDVGDALDNLDRAIIQARRGW